MSSGGLQWNAVNEKISYLLENSFLSFIPKWSSSTKQNIGYHANTPDIRFRSWSLFQYLWSNIIGTSNDVIELPPCTVESYSALPYFLRNKKNKGLQSCTSPQINKLSVLVLFMHTRHDKIRETKVCCLEGRIFQGRFKEKILHAQISTG